MSKLSLRTYVLEGLNRDDVPKCLIDGQQKESFIVQDLDDAYQRIRHFSKMMPRIKIFYAIKSNNSEMLVKLVASQGLGFDCATPGEIEKVLTLSVDPRSIVFAAPLKLPEWMVYARQSGVEFATFDSSLELKRATQYWPDVRFIIRIRVDGDSVYRLSDKYGCDFDTEAVDLLEEAARLGIKVVGVAFHVGSICMSAESYAKGIRMCRQLFDHEERMGRHMKIVDIGGGFLGETINGINEVSVLINDLIEEYFPNKDVQIIAEPGRYINETCMKLYCSINAVKRVKKIDKYINMIYLNDGIYGSLQCTEAYQTVHKYERNPGNNCGELEEAILWGNSLDTLDRVMLNSVVMLPKCSSLDWLMFPFRGAYSIVFATRFAYLKPPLILPVMSKSLRHKLKYNEAFEVTDFIDNPDVGSPLPSLMPPVVYRKSYLKSCSNLRE